MKSAQKVIDLYATPIYRTFITCARIIDAGFASKEQHAAYNAAKVEWYKLVRVVNSLSVASSM